MFDAFWQLYPRRVAKKDAIRAWDKLTQPQKDRAISAIREHIKLWTAENRSIEFIPHAATYLNGERFEDEIQMPEVKLSTPTNIIQFAKQKHIEARPGESMEEFTQRVRMTR